jgi:hypothetical protein
MPTVRLIVYDPPEEGYPFLAVALSPLRSVLGITEARPPARLGPNP